MICAYTSMLHVSALSQAIIRHVSTKIVYSKIQQDNL